MPPGLRSWGTWGRLRGLCGERPRGARPSVGVRKCGWGGRRIQVPPFFRPRLPKPAGSDSYLFIHFLKPGPPSSWFFKDVKSLCPDQFETDQGGLVSWRGRSVQSPFAAAVLDRLSWLSHRTRAHTTHSLTAAAVLQCLWLNGWPERFVEQKSESKLVPVWTSL